MLTEVPSNITARTRLIDAGGRIFSYRRFGGGSGLPLLFLQHFTGTMDNWDPAVTDPLAAGREVILFDNAGVGRSTGPAPDTIAGMAADALAFLDALGIKNCDVLGFSLGGMVAQQMVLDRPSIVRRMILVGTAPRGGDDIMHLDKPSLAQPLSDPSLQGYQVLRKIFFTPSPTSQAEGAAFTARLVERSADREPLSGPSVVQAQLAAFREWEQTSGEPFAELKKIRQPALVAHGVADEMIPVSNAYMLAAHLPNAVLTVFPDSGHGALFQFHDFFTRQVAAFLEASPELAPD